MPISELHVSVCVQNEKVEKLKVSLDEAMGSHKKAMDDNERLLNDLKKANTQCRVGRLSQIGWQAF